MSMPIIVAGGSLEQGDEGDEKCREMLDGKRRQLDARALGAETIAAWVGARDQAWAGGRPKKKAA